MLIQKEIVLPEIHSQLPFDASLFFDIETTGLAWQHSHIYLIGAAYCQDQKWLLRQWFLQKPSEEKELLQEFAVFLTGFEQIIHYNGNSFDLPYLAHKFAFYQLPNPLSALKSTDLYGLLRPFSAHLGLDSLKLQEVEAKLEIKRQDHHSGKELIACYKNYLQTGSQELLQELLDHNLEDVWGLLPLYGITAYHSLRKGEFTLASCLLREGRLILQLDLISPLPYPLHIRQDSSCLDAADSQARLIVQGTKGCMKHYFSNYKDYYYLPLEDQVVHKSIGIFVDAAHRRKARPFECCQKMTGLFFYQPQIRFQPAFYSDYHGKKAYFLPDDKWPPNPKLLKSYACDLLEELILASSKNK